MSYSNEELLDQCHPVFRYRLELILGELRSLEWKPRIVEVRRTPAQQAEKVRKGYSKTMLSWHVPSTQATLPLGGNSHLVVHGNAADVVDARYGWDGLAANQGFQFWKDLGRFAKMHGCSWGGDWKRFKDVAHIEFKFIEMPPLANATTAVV